MTESITREQRTERIEFMAKVYEAGYRLHEELDDVDPGYEYAIQQLQSELEVMGEIDRDGARRAMNLAQERVYGEPETEPNNAISEYYDA